MAFFKPNIEKLKARKDTYGLIAALSFDDSAIKIAAANALAKMYAKTAVDSLLVGLTDWDDEVQIASARAIGIIGSEKAIKHLVFALRERNPRLKSAVIKALCDIGFDAIAPIIETLKEDDEALQNHIIEALAELSQVGLKKIKHYLEDTSFEKRHLLLKVFYLVGDADSIDTLLDVVVNDTDFDMQVIAGQQLIKLGKKAVPRTLIVANFPNSDLPMMIHILAKIGDPRSQDFFIEYLDSSDTKMRYMCAKGLDNSGWKPQKDDNGIWYFIAKQQWQTRSEERRVGKECRSRWSPYH